MKNILLCFILFCVSSFSIAQKSKSTLLGNATLEELKMKVYSKDSTANAVVLYEHANVYLDEKRNYKFTTDFYFRVKLFNKEAFDRATISIPLRKKEKIYNIRAITHSITEEGFQYKISLTNDKIFTKDVNENWKEVTFTMPDVKEGAIIEYVYSITSPYSEPDDWCFQSDIPKISSDFTGSFLGNYKYNISIIGFLKLDRDESSILKGCVDIPGTKGGDCALLSYGIDNIPAFEEEEYMLSKRNFLSRLSFNLLSFTNSRGEEKRYTKTWKDADKRIRLNFLDNQHGKKGFFKNKLPASIFEEPNDLEKARKVHEFIKNHFAWNGKFWPNKKVRIKKAFEEKVGNVFDINLSLYNALQAVNIKSDLVLLATRSKGLPTKLHPITSEFNYLLVKAEINDKEFFLSATDKFLPFGLVPYNTLNGDGRVMDFKNGSFWKEIKSSMSSSTGTKMQMKLTDEGFVGNMVITRKGYHALTQRKKIKSVSEEKYLENFENEHSTLAVTSYKVLNFENLEKPLRETFEINIEEDFKAKKLRVNPFFMGRISKNPFKLKERNYPVDFGYPVNKNFSLRLNIPKEFKVKNLIKEKSLKLPNNGGYFIFKIKEKDHNINIFLKLNLLKKIYSKEEYFYLKELYKEFINIQNSFIELERI